MRSIHLILIAPAVLLLGCSEAPSAPLSPAATQLSKAPQVGTDLTKLLLSALNYSATEVGSTTHFSFELPLSGLYRKVSTLEASSHDPESFQFQHAIESEDHQPGWIRGAGLIHSMPPQATGAPFIVFGQGTLSIPVTGTRTEAGQTSTVSGTLVITLEEDVLEPKIGASYFWSCGSACVRFQLRAEFFPAGAVGPSCIVAGELTAVDPQPTEPF
jgi:hypothetical protein